MRGRRMARPDHDLGARRSTRAQPPAAAVGSGRAMPSTPPEPADLIDPEAPTQGGDRVDTAAYAAPTPPKAARKPRAGPAAPDAGGAEEPAAPSDAEKGEHVADPPVLDRALDAALALAADRRWSEISLRDVAERAGVSFASLYARTAGKTALLAALGDRYDRQALAAVEGDPQAQAHDRLFEAFMARLEAMQPHRDVLIAIGRAEPLAVVARLGATARALAEAAGVDTSGGRGALRLAALTGAWARTLQVWRDDEGALNRTMAEIDRRLRTAARRLNRVGAGF